jgi:GxxExxY protein
MEEETAHKELTRIIIGAAFEVSNTLGCGFLEKVYENALAVELRKRGLKVGLQVPMAVNYKGTLVGEYVADMIVEDAVLVENKAVAQDHPVSLAKTLNYLKATRLPVGLVLNFGQPRLGVKRVSLSQTLEREEHELDMMIDREQDQREGHEL